MSLLAEFEVASPDFVLGPTLEAAPALDIELERQYALVPEQPILFCWIRSPDETNVDRALERDRTVARFDRLERSGGRDLYRLERSDRSRTEVIESYRRWVALGGELLTSRAVDGRWTFEMRFPDRGSFTEYHRFLERQGVEFDLLRIADGEQTGESVLTQSQREALTLANEYGFFSVPREATLSDIAGALGISDQAVSERIRRGQARLIEAYLA
ncbi:helix-turn-helix domain-containing protein [Halostagnicola kamekurae]|uniref:Predicted DNA binding protein, contains HTH domain n=1 Tax=Halostagnicola kamekurae TaxID=619731 RepID=A0A1I6SUF8_9EURY|nr:helix-turn-helix domain-containing protein [Halostagnicola kamekurae]SFS80561.1 Predicted DNA binding protein, contains HTH domain [Halostagnicola kamekurae]